MIFHDEFMGHAYFTVSVKDLTHDDNSRYSTTLDKQSWFWTLVSTNAALLLQIR